MAPSLSGRRLAGYDVGPLVGAGGMGEVYRARDSKLNRDVAIKILLPAVATDTDRLARFRREAQVLASLNHPNIAHIHGIEEGEAGPFLVMEFVDGPTLADRIAQGPVPVDEAIAIARQIADALEAAHERGVIHRDLKPANIKVSDDGAVKVLDFGLAKAIDQGPGIGDQGTGHGGDSPTITTPAMTLAGVILGTAAYMSPEQAKGRVVDKRSDIWAFGCVLYEMLTGRRAFGGDDVTDTIAAVVRAEPDWGALPNGTPAPVVTLVKHCLDKDRRTRTGDISVARFVLQLRDWRVNESRPRTALAARSAIGIVAAAFATGVLASGALFAAWQWTSAVPGAREVFRFKIVPAAPSHFAIQGNDRDVAVAPNGDYIVYRTTEGARAEAQLMTRALGELEAHPLAGSASARNPIISPDGRWVAFGAQGELRKVALSGGAPITICKINGVLRGASWAGDGHLVFTTSGEGRVMRVPDGGGIPVAVTSPNRDAGVIDTFPKVLPDNHSALFTSWTGDFATSSIQHVDFNTGAATTLIKGATDGFYIAPDILVYMTSDVGRRTGTLRAVRFDLGRRQVVGEPVEVLADISLVLTGAANLDISRHGDLVYVSAADVINQLPMRRLMWVDRNGRETPLPAPVRAYAAARLSPDGSRIALDVRDENNDIWIWDIERQTLSALNRAPAQDLSPLWTADGKQIVWTSTRGGGNPNLFRQPFDSTQTPERLTTYAAAQFPTSITADGSTIITFTTSGAYQKLHRVGVSHLPAQMDLLLSLDANQYGGELSPDGRWLAYHSNESGQYQVYVRPYPDVNRARWPISRNGGSRAAWSRNGQELFYLDQDQLLTSVTVSTAAGAFKAGIPRKLLNTPYHAGASVLGYDLRAYDVSRDGRFLMLKDVERTEQKITPVAGMVVVVNWIREVTDRLKARLPTP